MQHQLDEQGAQLEFMKENREVSGRDLSLHAFENRKLLQQIRELQILVRDTKGKQWCTSDCKRDCKCDCKRDCNCDCTRNCTCTCEHQ